MEPLVSIIVPAYNAAGFIDRAIASIRAQTLQDYEILVVDDASTDATVATVEALIAQGNPIRLLRQARNGGVAVARNTGIDAAQGRYVAFLDADDAFLPERLEVLVQALETHQLDEVGDNQIQHDLHLGRSIGVMAFNPTDTLMRMELLPFLRNANNVPTLHEILTGRRASYFPVIKPVLRRAFLGRHGLRYDPACKIGEDFDLHVRCLIEGAKSAVVPQACYVYTVPYSEVSGTRSPNSRTVLNMEPVLRNVDHLLKVYGGRLSAQERRELARCRTGAKGLEDFEQLKADAREGRTNLALGLAARPALWPYAARSTAIKLRNRSARHAG